MKTATRRTSAPEKGAYIAAKRYLEERKEIAASILGECDENATDAEIEAYCEREAQIHAELGTLQAVIAVSAAEQVLLEWGIAQAKQAHPEHVALLERLAQTPILKYRQGAIALILKL